MTWWAPVLLGRTQAWSDEQLKDISPTIRSRSPALCRRRSGGRGDRLPRARCRAHGLFRLDARIHGRGSVIALINDRACLDEDIEKRAQHLNAEQEALQVSRAGLCRMRDGGVVDLLHFRNRSERKSDRLAGPCA